MKRIIKLSLIAIIMANLALVSGCNTVAGFGQDLQAGGEGITKAAGK